MSIHNRLFSQSVKCRIKSLSEIVGSQIVSKAKYFAFETFCKEVLIANEVTEAIEEEKEG